MFTDEREETLREVCALGNTKAVQHFVKAGVNLNSQNRMNGWTALHWASHRGHEAVVRILLSNGADPTLKTNKGQTALDLAEKYPGITELLSRVAQKSEAGPEPELPIVPTYMKEPDLEKSWLLPDEFAEAKVEKILRQRAAAESLTQSQEQQQQQQQQQRQQPVQPSSASSTHPEREMLVYLSSRSDENILGSVYLKNEPIESLISLIKEELDGLPENFSLARNNGKVSIPISTKQMEKPLLDVFRGEDDVLVILPKAS